MRRSVSKVVNPVAARNCVVLFGRTSDLAGGVGVVMLGDLSLVGSIGVQLFLFQRTSVFSRIEHLFHLSIKS